MSFWRAAGLNYVNYSNIAAKTLRKALKPELRAEAAKRDDTVVRCHIWVDGQQLPVGMKPEKKAGDKT